MRCAFLEATHVNDILWANPVGCRMCARPAFAARRTTWPRPRGGGSVLLHFLSKTHTHHTPHTTNKRAHTHTHTLAAFRAPHFVGPFLGAASPRQKSKLPLVRDLSSGPKPMPPFGLDPRWGLGSCGIGERTQVYRKVAFKFQKGHCQFHDGFPECTG